MLVLIRLVPRGDMEELCNAIVEQKRNLYWDNVKPLYILRQEGKNYLGVVLDVKNLNAIHKVFLTALSNIALISETRTIPIMKPIYFPLPEEHAENLMRFQVFLRVEPEKYNDVYTAVQSLSGPKDIHITYLSYSFGDDDIIISMLAKDREAALAFVNGTLGKMDGVMALDASRVVETLYLLPQEKLDAHKSRFMFSAPTGEEGHLVNQKAYDSYMDESGPMTVIVRLFAKTTLDKLWNDIEKNLPGFRSGDITPLYASQQEARDHITVIFEAKNFEVLNDVLTNNIPTMADVRKTRTIPMLDPTYFLLPKERPKNLERFLISLVVSPQHLSSVRPRIAGLKFPKNIFLTYLTFSLGEDDILLSILADSGQNARDFAKSTFGNMEGVVSYNVSNQLRTKRLVTPEEWKKHRSRFLSDFDREHEKDLDDDYDWTDDFHLYAAMTGAFVHELEN